MKTQKFSITAIIAVYFDNRGLVEEFPESVDLLAFLAGKKENETWKSIGEAGYNKSFETAKKLFPKQFPWLNEKVFQTYGNRPLLDYQDIEELEWQVKLRMHLAGHINYAKGDDLEVSL